MSRCHKIPFRVWIGVMIFFSTFINYATRANLSMSITSMVESRHVNFTPDCLIGSEKANTTDEVSDKISKNFKSFNWNEETQAHILGAFFYGYFGGMFFSGIIAEWLGPFWTIFISTSIAGVLNSATVYAALYDYRVLIFCRVLMGAAGSTIYPSLHVLMSRWAPLTEKCVFATCLLGNSVGTCVTWYAVARVTQHFGWPWGFHIVTIQIAVFLVVFVVLVTDYPDQNRWISKEESDYILESLGKSVSKTRVIPPYWAILKSSAFWGYTAAQCSEVWGIFFQLTGLPKFLREVVGLSLKETGIYSNLPQLSRMGSGIFFGWFGDYLIRNHKMTKRTVRKGFTIISHIMPGIFIASQWLNGCNPYGVVGLLSVSFGCTGAAVTTFVVNNQDIAPNFAGTIFAMALVMGSTTGFICPELTGALLREKNGVTEWGVAFMICGMIYIAGGLIFISIGNTEIQPWNEKIQDS